MGRPSYDTFGLNLGRNPFSILPARQNFALYSAIRETIPIVDAAIVKKRNIIGCPLIDAEPETRKEVVGWLAGLHVNGLQRGWGLWLGTWADNALHFGRSHSEILLTSDETDVWGIQNLASHTIGLRPHPDRISMEVVQTQAFSGEPTLLPPLRMLNWLHEVRGDDPNGTSLLWGMPFVTEIMQKLLKNLGSTWDRYGTPRYHINWDPPEDFDDPQGAQADEILADLAADFNRALESGIQGDIIDFYTSGKVTVSIIGAAGETLVFDKPMQEIAAQVVTRTGFPPSAFGLPWAQAEQLTQFNASVLSTDIDTLRSEATPEIEYLIDYRQRLTGGDRDIKLIWPKPTLIDVFNQARSDFFRENARQIGMRNDMDLWRIKALDQYEFVRRQRPELAHLTDEEIRARLPGLNATPPEETAPGDNGPGRTGTGGGGGLGPGSATGNMLEEIMKDEVRRVYVHQKERSNGNGS